MTPIQTREQHSMSTYLLNRKQNTCQERAMIFSANGCASALRPPHDRNASSKKPLTPLEYFHVDGPCACVLVLYHFHT